MESLKEKVKGFFSKRENQIILGIILIALLIRLYFFFKTFNQALWWDEADYMTIAKNYGLGTPEVAAPWRARGMSLIFGIFYFLGANEIFQRLVVVTVSTLAVFMTYLIGKEFYNKKVGMIAAAILAVSWVHLFWTTRFSGEVFGMVFFGFAALFFWRGYVLDKSKWYMIASGALIAYGIFLYESVGVIFVFLAVYLLATERFRFLKKKKFWWGILGLSIVLLGVFGHYYDLYGQIYPRVSHIIEGSLAPGQELDQKLSSQGFFMVFLSIFTFVSPAVLLDYLKWPLIILTGLGLVTFLDLVLGFDLVIKNQDEKLRKDFFIFWWAIATLAFFGVYLVITKAYYEPRYIFPALPAMFIIAARGIILIAEYVEKQKEKVGTIAIILLLLLVSYSQLPNANAQIENRALTFSQERPAGEWLKEHTEEGDILLACSQVVPLIYYSERETITYRYNTSEVDAQITNWSVPYIIVDMY
ncbi:glycosyltransferase family 39 protein, partial [Candidatus Woesearchaeota archaeon]|nr:glycosyltransferase family 39 protein [Candidatus Woesearchaeota archaeon]